MRVFILLCQQILQLPNEDNPWKRMAKKINLYFKKRRDNVNTYKEVKMGKDYNFAVITSWQFQWKTLLAIQRKVEKWRKIKTWSLVSCFYDEESAVEFPRLLDLSLLLTIQKPMLSNSYNIIFKNEQINRTTFHGLYRHFCQLCSLFFFSICACRKSTDLVTFITISTTA